MNLVPMSALEILIYIKRAISSLSVSERSLSCIMRIPVYAIFMSQLIKNIVVYQHSKVLPRLHVTRLPHVSGSDTTCYLVGLRSGYKFA